MKRTASEMKSEQSMSENLKEQVRILKRVTDDIQQSGECNEAIRSIAANHQDILKGVNEDDGHAVVDSLEPHLEAFYKLACAKELFSGALQAAAVSRTSPKPLPSVTAMCACLDIFVGVVDEKDGLHQVIHADSGSVVNDYLQGEQLTVIENVAKACAQFLVICNHVDEMVMLIE
jgi:hypothetical protein